MINTFRENPNQYLTAASCRTALVGDVCAIMRVHAFLEHWGLINYSITPNKPFSSSQYATLLHDYTKQAQQPFEKMFMFPPPQTSQSVPPPTPSTMQTNWTDEETLRLLDAIEKHGDNWAMVAQLVGTKTKEQCLQHFLKMPIEDQFLEENTTTYTLKKQDDIKEEKEPEITIPDDAPLPFADASNPIMATVAFLASMVNPAVAAAAAQAALSKL